MTKNAQKETGSPGQCWMMSLPGWLRLHTRSQEDHALGVGDDISMDASERTITENDCNE